MNSSVREVIFDLAQAPTTQASLERQQQTYLSEVKVVACVVIFFFFLIFYLYNGLNLITAERSKSQGIHDNDMYFQADSRYVVSALADADIKHNRILLHPLFIVYFNPLGHALNQIIQNRDITATVYCAMVGALGVVAAWFFFIMIGVGGFRSLLYASILGFSSSHLIFSVVPDTYIFSALGLIVLLMIACRSRNLWHWIAASVYLTGVTISNIAFALAAAFFYLFNGSLNLLTYHRKILKYGLGVGLTFVVLSIVQRVMYNKWMFQFMARAEKESQFLFLPDNLTEGWMKLKQLGLHMFFFNIVAPSHSMVKHAIIPDTELVSFQASSFFSYKLIGSIALIIWIIFAGVAFLSLVRNKLYHHKIIKTICLCLAINIGLHFFYGDDLMLYSCHWTFFVLTLIFYSLERARFDRKFSLHYNVVLFVFAFLLLMNNSLAIHDITHVF